MITNSSTVKESRLHLEDLIVRYLPSNKREAIIGLNKYTYLYIKLIGNMSPKIEEMAIQKLCHTMDMTCIMLRLAEDKSEERRLLYYWAGLLHDIGRVEDIRNASFKGVKGSNHAIVGSELLFQDGLIKEFPIRISYYKVLQYAIELHGDKCLEETIRKRELNLTETEMELCNDVRTADKWDIMSFLLVEPTKITIGDVESNIAKEMVSAKTLEELTNAKPVERNLLGEEYTHMRHFLSHVGFIYDITDVRLMKWLDSTNWVDNYLAKLPNPKDVDSLEKIRIAANDFISQLL